MAHRKSLLRRQVQVKRADGTWIDLGVADKFTGGGLKGEPEKYKRGDGSTVNLGADREREDATATYLQDGRIHAVRKDLDRAVGDEDNIRVLTTPLGNNRQPLPGGQSYTIPGSLTGLSEPESGGGENGGAEIELALALDTEAIY